MAEAVQLPDPDRDAIAGLLGPWIQGESRLFDLIIARPELAEGYEVWMLDETQLADSKRVREKATFTGEWHHQIRVSASTPLSARATVHPGVGWEINTVFSGRLVEDIQTASEWIDANIPTDDQVRLLLVPSWMRIFFWLEAPGRDRLVPIDDVDRQDSGYVARDAIEYLTELQRKPSLALAPAQGGSSTPVEATPPIFPAPDSLNPE